MNDSILLYTWGKGSIEGPLPCHGVAGLGPLLLGTRLFQSPLLMFVLCQGELVIRANVANTAVVAQFISWSLLPARTLRPPKPHIYCMYFFKAPQTLSQKRPIKGNIALPHLPPRPNTTKHLYTSKPIRATELVLPCWHQWHHYGMCHQRQEASVLPPQWTSTHAVGMTMLQGESMVMCHLPSLLCFPFAITIDRKKNISTWFSSVRSASNYTTHPKNTKI